MVNPQEFPRLMSSVTMLAGFLGAGIGVILSLRTGDAIGWALLRVSVLAAVFSYATRSVLLLVLKGWIQARMDHLIERAQTQTQANLAAQSRSAEAKPRRA